MGDSRPRLNNPDSRRHEHAIWRLERHERRPDGLAHRVDPVGMLAQRSSKGADAERQLESLLQIRAAHRRVKGIDLDGSEPGGREN